MNNTLGLYSGVELYESKNHTNSREIFIPVKHKSRKGVEYTRYKAVVVPIEQKPAQL